MAKYDLTTLASYFNIKLSDLDLPKSASLVNSPINQLRLDSRLVSANDIFIALKGQTVDGHDFIQAAISAGAMAILAETDKKSADKTVQFHLVGHTAIIQFNIYQLANQLSALAARFYDYPAEKMLVVGITGTNGKTTISQLIAQWVTLLGEKSAVLGTLGNGLYNQLTPSANTTSSAVEIQSYLADFYQQGAKLVAMEVSSHGLALGRVKDISFAASLFTNLSRDHLDFHKTMKAYEQAKWSLFSPDVTELAVKNSGKKVINFDDKVGKKWLNQLDDAVIVSVLPKNLAKVRRLGKPYLCVTSLSYHDKGVAIQIASSFGDTTLESRLLGSFNVSNLLLAFATLLVLDFPFYALVNTAPHLSPVCGRMEMFTTKSKPTVVVDYAHTPDALAKALIATKEHCHGKLWVVFGCGGDRDSGKRPLMAQIAEKYADNIIVTHDNPRTEDEEKIIADIVKGFSQLNNVTVIKERAAAIKTAITQSDENDIILVAGKGHEDYQIIGRTKHHYSDRETVCQLLGIEL